MLIQFSVENYKSFKTRAVMSLEASADKALDNNVTVCGRERYLNSLAVFGANAAGKSNIFSALTAAILLVRRSNLRQVNEPLTEIVPYRFCPESGEHSTSFEFVFRTEGKKYVYGLSATARAVEEEYLYVFNTSKASTIFERTKLKGFHYTTPALKRELKPIEERNTENKLFLATATMWNCESTRVPFLWFQEKINTYPSNFDQLFGRAAPMFAKDKDGTLQRFVATILHEADLNIDSYEFEMKDADSEDVPKEIKNIVSTVPAAAGKIIRIETIHNVLEGQEERPYRLGLGDESQGTRNLFLFAPILKRAFEVGETVCIDEFDSSLHPLLVIYLFGLFNNPAVNKAGAQLIVSAHSMALLSLKNLRRDQIYFVEKDRQTGVSELYSLDEFSPRKQENVRKAYLLGRYGSIPDIEGERALWP